MAVICLNDIRRNNKKKIRNVFKYNETLIASEIAALTRLSVVTVNAVLDDMCNTNEVIKDGIKKAKSGRPSLCYRYNRGFNYGFVYYAYNKGDKFAFRALVVNGFGEELYTKEIEAYILEEKTIFEIIDEQAERFPNAAMMVFGFPGYENAKCVHSVDFVPFVATGFFERCRARYGIETVFVNDVNAVIYGHNKKAGGKYQSEIGIFFPKNYFPGSGIIINNKIYNGTSNFAGEIGIIPTKISWDQLSQHSDEEKAEQVAEIILIMTSIVAPESFVIYCEYMDDNVFKDIKKHVECKMPPGYLPHIEISEEFDSDFRMGLIYTLMEKLEEEE